ncbi:hypothetical protein Q73A0000_15410 [Kaistella flava (ex Peng et al. 2021)]|uniref:Tetratricopeptide repeat protein n=1 Tax=Kaistella flava (ex Peng et al. 2021) TaxID=2038776 RepID=A0A7M2YC14_9FLAO|nr:hypothetical protein [Kaistella flava (ex Peng et al. 2021)]QOW11661.1 hypothetical protein Q73A0000_15410 [Kaistella flava (ex Peng et al. 2021)]
MKKERVINTQRALVAALFLGAVTFGYAQEAAAAQETVANATAQVQTSQQNPAIDALKKKIEANPNDTESLVNLATAYQDAKDWKNALGTWNKISTLLPDWAPSYYSEGYVYQNMKDDANAKTAYEKYIAAVKPEELEASKKNLAYAHLFVAYQLKESNKEQAKQHIAKSLEYDPSNQDALNLSKFLNQ